MKNSGRFLFSEQVTINIKQRTNHKASYPRHIAIEAPFWPSGRLAEGHIHACCHNIIIIIIMLMSGSKTIKNQISLSIHHSYNVTNHTTRTSRGSLIYKDKNLVVPMHNFII